MVLNFWATWCPPCVRRDAIAGGHAITAESPRRDRAGGQLGLDEDAYQKFVRDHAADLLTVRDRDQKSNVLYGTYKFPETYIIDRKGVIRRKFIGAVDWTQPDIEQYLTSL